MLPRTCASEARSALDGRPGSVILEVRSTDPPFRESTGLLSGPSAFSSRSDPDARAEPDPVPRPTRLPPPGLGRHLARAVHLGGHGLGSGRGAGLGEDGG